MSSVVSSTKGFRGNRQSEGGFTLIELLIVIVILGILAGVVAFSLSGATGQATKSACQSDSKTVVTAVAAALADNPSTTTVTQSDLTGSSLNGGPFVQSWPSNSSYSIEIADGTSSYGGTVYPANDVLVKVGTAYTDATSNPSNACDAA